jgi:nickel transport protein
MRRRVKRTSNGNRVLLCALMAGLVFPAGVFGHGVEVYDIMRSDLMGSDHSAEGPPLCAVYFKYSTGEPISYARVKLYPPSALERNVESLVSITDRNGVFSFLPDEEGAWRVDMEDGMGHKGTITVNAAFRPDAAGEPAAAIKTAGSRPPLVFNIGLGLSLLLNIFGIWYVAGRRGKTAEAGNAHQ